MAYNFPKPPKDMSPQEVFDTMQQMQQLAQSQGQNYIMYTKTTLPKGQKPTLADMHEEAARQQLTALYEGQNKAVTNSPQGQQVAENLAKASANTIGTARDAVEQYSNAKKQQNGELYGFGYEAGVLKAGKKYVTDHYGDNPEVWRGYADGLDAAKKRDEARNK